MDRELSTDPRLCDMFPQARAEPRNDVSALVPPARGQEGVNEIIPARLTTKTEKRGLKPTQSGPRDAPIESRLTLSVLPRVEIGVAGSYRPCSPERNPERRSLRGGLLPLVEGEMRQVCDSHKWRRKTERRATHAELVGWSPSLLSGFSNSQTAALTCAPRPKCRLGVLLLLRRRKRGNTGQVPAKYGSTSACFYITASSAFFLCWRIM